MGTTDAPMAALAAERSMKDVHQEGRSLHPFFEKRTKPRESLPTSEHTPVLASISVNPTLPPIIDNHAQYSAESCDIDPNHDRRKRLKSASPHAESRDMRSVDPTPSTESKTTEYRRESRAESEVGEQSIENTLQLTQEIAKADGLGNLTTPKPPIPVEMRPVHPEVEESQTRTDHCLMGDKVINPLLQAASLPSESNVVDADSNINTAGSITPIPKKILRLNPKTGTIGSPPMQKASSKKSGSGHKTSSGRPPKQPKSLLVCLRYSQNSNAKVNIGNGINQILSGTTTYTSLQKLFHSSPEPVVDVKPPKTTHPFFLGKIAPRAVTPIVIETPPELDAIQSKSGSGKTSMTLGEARSLAPIQKQASGAAFFPNFGSSHKLPKVPGAVEACWPRKEVVHVRGHDIKRKTSLFQSPGHMSLSTAKKSKYAAAETLVKDDLLRTYARKLGIINILNDIQKIDGDGFTQPEKCLRLPEKHFESGLHMQRRIRHQLFNRLPLVSHPEGSTPSEDELQGDLKDPKTINAALLKIYNGIATSLTAFDRCQYETQSWVQKYAPCCAAEVLQSGKEASILRDWLQGLTVVSVETGTRDSSRSRGDSLTSRKAAATSAENAGKRKRKSNKLEGFVISSDEEGSCMDEISDPEEYGSSQPGLAFPKRTVIRSGSVFGSRSREPRKLKNAVVISGPTGCGKTAMVYAIAKELGFEVFEINSSSRRSGKEILEKVGDMTRNHLVHTSEQYGPTGFQDEDAQRVSDALAADLSSGRQGTMNSFFKPKKTTQPNANSKSSRTARKDTDTDTSHLKTPKAPPKVQKQSLILFEEVDILYEEDKQFWTTVMNLITTSKRPIIMTCNDETILPLHALTLHAIIRLSAPPTDVAVDYMLLVAAAEGHVLKRKVVKALYEARKYDLRASLTELNYWCQLGVGDRKGGLDWCYPRWPPGCDLDRSGSTIRVVSEGTYKTGMGWLGRDLIFDRLDETETQEQLFHEAWDGWNIDAGELHASFDASHLFDGSSLPVLSSYEEFADTMSMADLCACGSLSTGNQVLLDRSSPPISAKVREDFIIGYELLQADTVAYLDPVQKSIPLWMKAQACQILQSNSPAEVGGISETRILSQMANIGREQDEIIDRKCFNLAFDPIAVPDRISQQTGSALDCSVFDRTTSLIAVDVAPYVRSIVAYDLKLQQRRAKLSNLLSEGGRKGKRIRTTRSALSALEGGTRKTTRPEKYFQAELNPYFVQRTGLKYWQEAVTSEAELESRTDNADHIADWDENSNSGVSSGQ